MHNQRCPPSRTTSSPCSRFIASCGKDALLVHLGGQGVVATDDVGVAPGPAGSRHAAVLRPDRSSSPQGSATASPKSSRCDGVPEEGGSVDAHSRGLWQGLLAPREFSCPILRGSGPCRHGYVGLRVGGWFQERSLSGLSTTQIWATWWSAMSRLMTAATWWS